MLVSIWYGWYLFVRLLIIGMCEFCVKCVIMFCLNVWIMMMLIICEMICVEFLMGLLWLSCVLCVFMKMV